VAIGFLYNSLKAYNLQDDEYRREEGTIRSIMYNNAFPIHPHNPPNPNSNPIPKHSTPTPDEQITTSTQERATFTYIAKETTFITNLFRKTDLTIALPTNNTIQSLLMQKQQAPDKYTQSAVYRLTWPDCNKAYVGQTGRTCILRFNEHKNAFKTNSCTTNFAKYLAEKSLSLNSTHNTMQILKCHSKVTQLNTIERYYIYAEYIKKNHLNDDHTIN
jgi:hypothetical protein